MAKKRKGLSKKRAEQQFLASYDASRFSHPSVTADVALITIIDGVLKAAMIQREEHPDLGKWSLPGGFVQFDESVDDAANRVLQTKAGLEDIFLEQLFTFGEPDRDPRTRVISIAYYALVHFESMAESNAHLKTVRVPWKGEKGGPVQVLGEDNKALDLAFDHADILGLVVKRLRGKLNYAPIGFELLPARFTLRQLQTVHETILDRELNKDSFRRRMLASGVIAATGKRETNVGHRPAELYRFRRSSLKRGR